MGKNQSASGLTNIVQYDNDGNISLVSGSTTLLYISSSGAITTRGIISGSNALSASYAASASNAISGAYAVNATTASYAVASTTASYSLTGTSASYAVNATTASYAVASTSASYATDATTASYAVASTNAANATLFNNTASSVFSTTGSNTLTGTQYVSNTSNATGFSNTTASIYTDGGLQVTKDAYFSSSMFIKGNLTVFGTQSVSFITSSQLNISTNLITVNTDTPSIRFGGLAVYDSGSTGLTGSILWDSQNNHWIYTNPSGSSYSGGMLISGPRNTGSIGDEQGTTLNAIMKGMGGDHITSSIMFESASLVGIGTTSPSAPLEIRGISGNGTPTFKITSTSANDSFNYAGSMLNSSLGSGRNYALFIGQALSTKNSGYIGYNHSGIDGSASNFLSFGHFNNDNLLNILSSGNVGIGTTSIVNASAKLEVKGDIFLTPTSSAASKLHLYNNDSSNETYIYDSGSASTSILAFAPGGVTKMVLNSSGYVGIGITNPSYVLHARSSETSGAPIVGYFQSAGGDAQLHVTNGTVTTQLTADNTNSISIVGSMTNHPLVIRTGNTERMRITYSNGYVGINNIAPLDRLDVAGTIRATVNTSYFTTFGYTGGTQIRMVSPSAETADNMVFKIDGASSSTAGNQFIFQTQSGNTTPVTTLWISKLGDVNIGTTSSTKYQVLNLINDANTLGAAIGLARSSGQFITNAGAGDLVIGNATNKNILFGNTGAGTTEYMRITSGGIVTRPLQPAFSAGKSTNESVSAGATVIFNYTSGTKFNVGGYYNASTGIFTAPVAGVYIFSASIIWMNVPNGQAMDDSFWIYKNGDIAAYGLRRAEYESTYTGNGGYFVDFANVLLSLAVGDTVKVVNNRALDIHGNTNYSYFYGYLL